MLDSAFISALVAEHGRWLMAFLRGMGNAADAEDAFQEVWLRVMRASADPANWKAYLTVVARSVVIDRLRRTHPADSLDEVDEEIPDVSPAPDERYASKATAEAVRAAIAALPFNLRQVVLMRVEGEMEFKDIATELGVPLGTTLTWMHRATQELKRRLNDI